MTDNTQLAAELAKALREVRKMLFDDHAPMLDVAAFIDAALTQSPMCCEAERERWQPIETAPKELGAGVLAWDEACVGEPYIASWTRNGWFDSVVFRAPTHWMPLPEPPATAIRGADQ